MKKFDVLVIGELNVDLILRGLNGVLPEIGKEILAEEMTLTLGSSSAIFAANLSTLGPRVSFLGKIGHDNFGDLVLSSLEARKVDTSHILRSRDHYTGITIVLSYVDDRANITYPGAMDHLSVDEISREVLREAKHLHLSSVFLQKALLPGVVRLFRMAKEEGLTTSFDPQWDPEERWEINLQELLPFVDLFLPNMEEIKQMTGTEDVEEAVHKLSAYANVIVVKDGARGAYMWAEGVRYDQRAFLNPAPVDTVGAGDSFNAGFIARFVKGAPLPVCLEQGALTGAVNTTSPGGISAFDTLDKARALAKKHFNKEL